MPKDETTRVMIEPDGKHPKGAWFSLQEAEWIGSEKMNPNKIGVRGLYRTRYGRWVQHCISSHQGAGEDSWSIISNEDAVHFMIENRLTHSAVYREISELEF